jgi:hypothetical protein
MLVYTDSVHPITGWPRTIMYEQTVVPHVMADHPVSPPGSPREEGEVDDYIPEYDIVYNIVVISDWVGIYRGETAYQNKRSFPKNSKRKTISKNMRKMGRLKQPGGSSCNQRR